MSGRLIEPSLFADTTDGAPALAGSQCRTCSTVTFPAQGSCPRCTSEDVERRALARRGVLWAFTEQAFPPKTPYLGADGPFQPYLVGYVDLGGEVLVESRLVTDDRAALRIGMPMELVIEEFHVDDDGPVSTFAFRPATEEDR